MLEETYGVRGEGWECAVCVCTSYPGWPNYQKSSAYGLKSYDATRSRLKCFRSERRPTPRAWG